MSRLDALMALIEEEDIDLYRLPFSDNIKGLYGDGTIAVSTAIDTESEFVCVVAEELGHHYTSHGNLIDQSQMANQKQEVRARRWAHDYLIPLDDLIAAYHAGVCSRYELAEYLEVTEAFLIEALEHLQHRYGPMCQHRGYWIYFEPLGVLSVF